MYTVVMIRIVSVIKFKLKESWPYTCKWVDIQWTEKSFCQQSLKQGI